MKQILLIVTLALVAVSAIAVVSAGKAQRIIVFRNADQQLQFKVDDDNSFANVDQCAKHCYQRSWFAKKDSEWANLVNIHVTISMSPEDRQYIGDRFAANNVYPHHITWVEDGVTNKVVYKPDDKSVRNERKLE